MNTNLKLTAVSATALMLAAAPALAQTKSAAPTLALGGYYDQKMSYQEQDRAGYDSTVDVRNDVEIYFLGNVTLDNGIKISTRVELEGGTNADGQAGLTDGGNSVNGGDNTYDQIDEAFMTISGSFGSVKIGMADTAAKSMTTGLQGTWGTNVGENVTFNATKLIAMGSGVTGVTGFGNQLDLTSDGEMVSYTTPSFAGFQMAVGYAQNDRETFDGQIVTTGAGKTTTDIWDVAVKYSGKFDNVAFNIGGGYTTANDPTNNEDDPSMYMVGGNVTFGAIKLAASMTKRDDQKTSGVTTTAGYKNVELGAQYTMGPNSFSLVYTKGEAISSVVGVDGDEATYIGVAWARALGKGVTWHNTLFRAESEDSTVGAVNTDNSGYALTTGILVKF